MRSRLFPLEDTVDKILYLFYKPEVILPFYCGIGTSSRPQEHFEASNLQKRTLFYNTLRKMLLESLMPRIKIVETGLTWLEACDLESNSFYSTEGLIKERVALRIILMAARVILVVLAVVAIHWTPESK